MDSSLVSASLSRGFRLLSLFHRRLFVKLFLAKVADDTVAGAFSLETAQRAFEILVIPYTNRRHVQPSFAEALSRNASYPNIITNRPFSVNLFSGGLREFFP